MGGILLFGEMLKSKVNAVHEFDTAKLMPNNLKTRGATMPP